MKLSEIDPKSLTNEELWDIVCGDIADDGAFELLETAKKIGFKTVGIFDKNNYGQDRLEAASDFYLSEGHSLDELIAVNV